MLRLLPRFLLVLLCLLPCGSLLAEKVADLPVPKTYVNDFAHVLSPTTSRSLEDLSAELHNQTQADVVVVTVKSLDDGQSIEEFTAALEEKWKVGKKGEDRSALVVLALNPRRLRVETGYGLEGILNDAKVGRILDPAVSSASSGDYDQAITTVVQGLANVIAADKGVALTPTVHRYHRESAQPQRVGIGQIVLGVGFLLLILILVLTGHAGWAFYLVLNLLGGGGGSGRDDDDRGGGFGGIGGGSSGGGGASRDF
jgi:uncharacterized protein